MKPRKDSSLLDLYYFFVASLAFMYIIKFIKTLKYKSLNLHTSQSTYYHLKK